MSKAILSDLDFGSASRILNLPDATLPQHPATLAQLNSAVEGLAWKDSVRVATAGNISLTAPGAALDSITLAVNDRVLARAQTLPAENGIYIWNGAATPMTRALDASTASQLEQAVVSVEEGSSAGATFRQSTVNFTLDSGSVVWTTFGAAAPSATEATAGIAEIATQAETDAGTDDLRIVTPAKLAAYSGKAKRFSQTIGDGAATSYTVTHNLGTRDVQVEIYRNSGNYDSVLVDTNRTSANAVVVVFASAPVLNGYRVVVVG